MTRASVSYSIVLCALLLAGAGCNRERTELVIGLATDLAAPDEIDAVHLKVERGGAKPLEQDWSISGFAEEQFNLPASFGIYPKDDDETPTVHITLSGLRAGKEIIQRRATLTMVAHKTLFLRMALVSRCYKPDIRPDEVCGQGETCVEGVCMPEQIDANLLSSYRQGPFPREGAAECRGRVQLINTANRQPLFLTGPGDCPDEERCIESICYPVAPHCRDGVPNGDETGTDCGGAACRGCLGGDACNQDRDCLTGSCNEPGEDPEHKCTAAVAFRRSAFSAPEPGRVSLGTVDIDEDGEVDAVLVAREGAGRVDIYPYDPALVLGKPTSKEIIDGPIGITVGDFDRDHVSDFAVAYRGLAESDGGVEIFRSGGGAPFSKVDIYRLSSRPAAIVGGDLNGDLAPDLITVNPEAGTISVLLNDGAGAFAPGVDYAVGPVPRSVTIAHLDDGHAADMAVASTDLFGFDGNVSVLHNQGDGTFMTPDLYRAGTEPRALVAGDFNGDDKDDLAVIDDADGSVGLLINEGIPVASLPYHVQFRLEVRHVIGAEPAAITIGDFEADTTDDLVVANRGDGTVTVLADYTNGAFDQVDSFGAGDHARALAVANFDRKGLRDVAVATDGGLVLLLNEAPLLE